MLFLERKFIKIIIFITKKSFNHPERVLLTTNRLVSILNNNMLDSYLSGIDLTVTNHNPMSTQFAIHYI